MSNAWAFYRSQVRHAANELNLVRDQLSARQALALDLVLAWTNSQDASLPPEPHSANTLALLRTRQRLTKRNR